MRLSTRLVSLLVLLLTALTALTTLPIPALGQKDGRVWRSSPESLILAMYASPIRWLWTRLPSAAVDLPIAETADRSLVLSAPSAPEGTTAFAYDDTLSMEQRLSQLRRITACLEVFPERLKAPLTKITVKAGTGSPRGQSDGRQIIIRSILLSDEELCNVMAHEMGHVIDLGLLSGEGFEASAFKDGTTAVLQDDLSVEFYSVSWETEERQKNDATRLDFVTGYARMNAFEEFGEIMETYVRQGNYLRSLLPTSEALRKKYAFMRDVIFEGTEFNTGKPAENTEARKFDSTLVGIKYN